ncbi:hypothetical protein HBH69_226000 [Parastagonospora nodorum]|nr:hypothetical protein HBH69_226000 [Parastagonospora nodorum]
MRHISNPNDWHWWIRRVTDAWDEAIFDRLYTKLNAQDSDELGPASGNTLLLTSGYRRVAMGNVNGEVNNDLEEEDDGLDR